MANLIIENFPDSLYEKLKERAEREHRSIDEEVVHLLGRAIEPLSILELKGLGKELWEGIDPDAYIREERDSWDRDFDQAPIASQERLGRSEE